MGRVPDIVRQIQSHGHHPISGRAARCVVEALIGSHFKTAGLSDAAIFDGKATFAEYWGPRSPCTTSCTRRVVPPSMVGVSETSGELQSEFANGKLATYGRAHGTNLPSWPTTRSWSSRCTLYPGYGSEPIVLVWRADRGLGDQREIQEPPRGVKVPGIPRQPRCPELYGSSSGQIITRPTSRRRWSQSSTCCQGGAGEQLLLHGHRVAGADRRRSRQ